MLYSRKGDKMREKIETFCKNNELEVLFLDNFDEAIICLIKSFNIYKILYDTNKILSILSKDMTEEDAIEFFEYNIIGSYVGESTPAFTEDV